MAVKKNMYVILVGVAVLHIAVLGGLLVSGGCSSTVMNERQYAPAAGGETPMDEFTRQPPVVQPQPTVNEVTPPVPVPAAPKAQPREAVKLPVYEPMTGVTSSGGVSSAPVTAAAGGTYVVKAGDTVGKIANAHGVSLSAMLKANGLDLNSAKRIRPGRKLVIPTGGKPVTSVKTSEKSVTKGRKGVAPVKPGSAAPVAADGTYTVKAGDTIPGIAKKLGIRSRDLQNANNLSDEATRRLQIGQKLVIPGKGGSDNVVSSKPVQPTPQKPDISIDDLIKGAQNATVHSDPVIPPADNGAPVVPAVTENPVVPVTEKPNEVVTGNSQLFEITDDQISLEDFAKKYNTTVSVLKQLNPELPKDNTLRKGSVIFIPAE